MEAKVQFAQKAIIINNNKILLVRTSMEDTSSHGMWELPGGRLNESEDLENNIIREVMEETGLTIVPGDLADMWSWYPDSGIRIVAVSRYCTVKSDPSMIYFPESGDKLSDIGWFSKFDLTNLNIIPSQIPSIRKGFENKNAS